MIEIDLDGQKVSVPEGSMVMHAADQVGTYIPHFCYHKKLTIAANCRMCLVEIEKAPKPMPACATPVTQGMVVKTRSDKALNAQQGVMEFLLINHPLDCPICDQGGECQLQDLAVGYGASSSRYDEDKRVVYPKDVGPLISMQEMNRCIHCTRCVRFGQEVAGVMELGMIHRGEHSEITTIAGETIDSELSGNMIDICPVGALTSKPFRYSARTWELSRRKSVSPHDSTGANLIVQVKGAQVMRVVPLENEAVNECWIADRDRFSYEALNGPERLTSPMIRQGGDWKTVSWTDALDYVARGLTQISVEHGAESIGAIAAPMSTVEELHLARQARARPGQREHRQRAARVGVARGGSPRWLGRSIASLAELQRVLVVGSFLRKDHPLFAARLRQATKKGAKVMSVHALRDDWLMPMGPSIVAAPGAWAESLAAIAAALAASQGRGGAGRRADHATRRRSVAAALESGERKAVLLGNAAAQHPTRRSSSDSAAGSRSRAARPSAGWSTAATASARSSSAPRPRAGGATAAGMLGGDAPLKAALLLNIEPSLDSADPAAALAALGGAEMVVALTVVQAGRRRRRRAAADRTLHRDLGHLRQCRGPGPELPWRRQAARRCPAGVEGAARARQPARALRLRVPRPRRRCATKRSATSRRSPIAWPRGVGRRGRRRARSRVASAGTGLERIADVPIYSADAIVRRAPALQLTADARPPAAGIPSELAAELGIVDGSLVRVHQGAGLGRAAARRSILRSPPTWSASPPAILLTAALGPMFGAAACRARGRRVQRRRALVARDESDVSFDALPELRIGRPRRRLAGRLDVAKIVALVVPLLVAVAYLTLWESARPSAGARSARARTASARSACCSRSPTPSS